MGDLSILTHQRLRRAARARIDALRGRVAPVRSDDQGDGVRAPETTEQDPS